MAYGERMMEKITVKYGKLKKVVDIVGEMGASDDSDVSFEYVVGSCFPDIMKNIQNVMRAQYTEGYIAGLQEGKVNEKTDTKHLS